MSHEKVGAIRTYGTESGLVLYERKQPGVSLPYDFMTKEQRENLSGPVKIYYIEVDKDD